MLVAYISIVSGDPGPTPGDTQAADVAAELQTGWLTEIAKMVTALGSSLATTAVALVAAVALALRRRWPEVCVLVVAAGHPPYRRPGAQGGDSTARARPTGWSTRTATPSPAATRPTR